MREGEDPGTNAAQARLTWPGGDALPSAVRDALMGRGAPHEMVVEDVLGVATEVFAQRAPNLRALLDKAARTYGDRPYLVAEDRSWSFAEAQVEVAGLTHLLIVRYGIEPGDRVAIVAANSPEYALLIWATVAAGAVVTGLNGWWTGPELRHGIELTSPRLIAGDERRLARLPDDVGSRPVVSLTELVEQAAAGGDRVIPEVDSHEDDPAFILFTSGTTGRPKGATISHRNVVNFGKAAALSAAVGRHFAPPDPGAPVVQPAAILASPLFHVSGILGVLMSGPVFGTKLVFAPPGRWDATTHLDLMVRHRVTSWSGVPTQFWRVMRHPDLDRYDLGAVRTIGSGGAPFPPELVRVLGDHLPAASPNNGYGTTETFGLGTINGGPMMSSVPEAVGIAQPGVEVEIRDADGRPLAAGDIGEIHVRGASVFLGYWEDPEATDAAFAAGRWYRTGDFGRVVDGLLHLESRARDLVIRGGENVYPIEVERRLVEHPDIDDAAVIGIDHADLGQEVKAFVVPRPGATVTAADVRAWVAAALAPFKVPAHVEFRSELPYTDTGKVVKHQLESEERRTPTSPRLTQS